MLTRGGTFLGKSFFNLFSLDDQFIQFLFKTFVGLKLAKMEANLIVYLEILATYSQNARNYLNFELNAKKFHSNTVKMLEIVGNLK